MFTELFIGICLTLIIIYIKLYKSITLFSFKTLAFGIDLFVILFYSIYLFHTHLSIQFLNIKMQYLLSISVGILTIIIYGLLILFINDNFPIISNAFNLLITFIGVCIAIPFTIGLLTPVIQLFNDKFTFNGDIILSQNYMLNFFLKYIFFGLITLPVWRYRMRKLEIF